jgi:hypothetical protein
LCFLVRLLFSLIRRSRKDTYVPRTSAINVAQLSAWLAKPKSTQACRPLPFLSCEDDSCFHSFHATACSPSLLEPFAAHMCRRAMHLGDVRNHAGVVGASRGTHGHSSAAHVFISYGDTGLIASDRSDGQ